MDNTQNQPISKASYLHNTMILNAQGPGNPEPVKEEFTGDRKTLITILLLILFFPIGFIVMWFWSEWKILIKFVVTTLGLLFIIFIIREFKISMPDILTTVDPVKQFAQARDTQRRSDVNVISSAIYAYITHSSYATVNSLNSLGITTLCTAGSQAIGTGPGQINLEDFLVPKFIAAIPTDPSNGNYAVCVNDTASSRFTITATPELATEISISR